MTDKEKYLKRFYEIKNRVVKKYGAYLYFLIADIINICAIEKVVEDAGFTTKRINLKENGLTYSEVYKGDKHIASIQGGYGFATIEFVPRNKGLARKLSKNELFIEPIKGVHRVLDWHEVEDKMHILAGGEIVLHAIPNELSDETCKDFFKDFTDEMIENIKKKEEETLSEGVRNLNLS